MNTPRPDNDARVHDPSSSGDGARRRRQAQTPAMEHRAFWVVMLVSLVLVLGACFEMGRRLRLRAKAREHGQEETGLGPVEAASFSLLGLLLAFAFSGAAGRFDDRRQLAIAESNALGTAYLRLSLVPGSLRPSLQAQLRAYTDARLAGYRALPDAAAARGHFERATRLQAPLWEASIKASEGVSDSRAAILLLPALNTAFDLATTRTAVFFLHPPPVTFVLLFALALLCSVLAGWSMGATPNRRRLHALGFVGSLALTLYLTVDLELPSYGLVTVENFDAVLAETRARMN